MPFPSMLSSRTAVATAPPNIALVKYWGKRDETHNLPSADSVSICLDSPRTRVQLVPAAADGVVWNGRALGNELLLPYQRVLETLRRAVDPVEIQVTTSLPVAAGLAGSAAVMAALVTAGVEFFGRSLDARARSALARLGSGSAARSVPSGFAYWERGSRADGSDSYATSFAGPDHWPELRLVALFLEAGPKRVSSTVGMRRTAATSPMYADWVVACNQAAPLMRAHILARDFAALAAATREQAMLMHATCLTARPPILYLSRQALAVLDALRPELPEDSWCATFDAGTNPIFLTLAAHLPALEAALDVHAPGIQRLVARPGKGAQLEIPDLGQES